LHKSNIEPQHRPILDQAPPGLDLRWGQPVQTETRTVPSDDGPGPDNRKRIKNAREEAKETNEHQSVDGTERVFLGGGSSQNNDLLPQCPNLCLERCPRPQQIDNRPTNEPEKIRH
jgi:hypothetical protein